MKKLLLLAVFFFTFVTQLEAKLGLNHPHFSGKLDAQVEIKPKNFAKGDPRLFLGCKGGMTREYKFGLIAPKHGGWLAEFEVDSLDIWVNWGWNPHSAAILWPTRLEGSMAWIASSFDTLKNPNLDYYLNTLDANGEFVMKRVPKRMPLIKNVSKGKLPRDVQKTHSNWELKFDSAELKASFEQLLVSCPVKTRKEMETLNTQQDVVDLEATPAELSGVSYFQRENKEYYSIDVYLSEIALGYASREERGKTVGIVLKALSEQLSVDHIEVQLFPVGGPPFLSWQPIATGYYFKKYSNEEKKFIINAHNHQISESQFRFKQLSNMESWRFLEVVEVPNTVNRHAKLTRLGGL
ncbi:hypothetical protein [Pseudovibrio sp. Ad37]|uniref:hypothetical protein n=1 Tax=Pseudovibrio sp. Ad37 TaxID=989422 RepID=UPI0007AE808A|nr:hypothetical protein [Pseudovibrio sp. Ad37]KZL21074.1 hypothetical protein PsAD37_03544 [Pseudovibrio sp. Ad37]